MSQLSMLVNQEVKKALDEEGFDARISAARVFNKLDDESKERCCIAELIRQLKRASVRLTEGTFQGAGSAQIELPFNIDGAVSIDVDARKIRLTGSLTQIEFVRAMDIRRKQIRDDQKSLREWEEASRLANPYWKDHPDWTFGQCASALTEDLQNAQGQVA